MFGCSYGGYTSIMVAMWQPPSLKAIVPMCATDDRYTEGDQYRGGAMRGLMNTGFYGPFMLSMNALPPYPEYSGKDWSKIWEEHLEGNFPWALKWIDEQSDGPYWQEAVGRKYDRIKCPTFAISGWMDYFPSAMARLYTNLRVPKKLLIGPWAHGYPDTAEPGPNIDYLREVVRWFAYWLNGDETGIMEEPPVTVYMQEFTKPERVREKTNGFWRNEDSWQPERLRKQTFHLGYGKLLSGSSAEVDEGCDSYEYNPVVGTLGGPWPHSQVIRQVFPGDQRAEDALSLVYETEPLEEGLEILGWPTAKIYASSTSDVAFFVARLCDVAPDGVSAQVTKGVLNATRRESMEHPKALEPGKIYELDMELDATSWVFEKGHRIRLSINSSDWPDIWPSPKKAVNTVYRGTKTPSRFVLPVIPEQNPKLPEPRFMPPPKLPATAEVSTLYSNMNIVFNVYDKTVEAKLSKKSRIKLLDGVGVLYDTIESEGVASVVDPADVFIKGTQTYRIERKDMVVESKGSILQKSTADTFHLIIDLEVTLNGMPHFSRRWMKSVPRKLI